MGHLRNLFFLDYPQLVTHRKLLLLPYAFSSMGHQAVIIFFVMSGFLVGGHILRAIESGRWSWRAYLLQRGVRLWIVLLPALLLGALLDFLAFRLHLAPGLYAGQVPDHITYNVHAHSGLGTFLGNCLFLQSILTRVFDSNGALWSLANEFWYYLLFPLGLLAVRRYYPLPMRLIMAVGCLATAAFVGLLDNGGNSILPLFPVWLLGVLLAVPPPATPVGLRWAALALYAPFCALLAHGHLPGPVSPDYALALATFAFLWILLGARQPVAGAIPWYVAPSRTLAGFSYTLYFVHTPVLMLVAALTVHESRWSPDILHVAIAFIILLAVIVYGYGVASLTELRTPAVRDWLSQRLLPSRVPARPRHPV